MHTRITPRSTNSRDPLLHTGTFRITIVMAAASEGA